MGSGGRVVVQGALRLALGWRGSGPKKRIWPVNSPAGHTARMHATVARPFFATGCVPCRGAQNMGIQKLLQAEQEASEVIAAAKVVVGG